MSAWSTKLYIAGYTQLKNLGRADKMIMDTRSDHPFHVTAPSRSSDNTSITITHAHVIVQSEGSKWALYINSVPRPRYLMAPVG